MHDFQSNQFELDLLFRHTNSVASFSYFHIHAHTHIVCLQGTKSRKSHVKITSFEIHIRIILQFELFLFFLCNHPSLSLFLTLLSSLASRWKFFLLRLQSWFQHTVWSSFPFGRVFSSTWMVLFLLDVNALHRFKYNSKGQQIGIHKLRVKVALLLLLLSTTHWMFFVENEKNLTNRKCFKQET